MSIPLPLRFYPVVTTLLAPLIGRKVRAKLRRHGVSKARTRERLGYATVPRPEGTLIWLHAASVGESLSILPLIDRIADIAPHAHCLVTTGTASSAEILARRLPATALHQFAPLDAPLALGRFFAHWQPDVLALVESEIWPGMITKAAHVGCPVALINARLSAGSLRTWQKVPASARALFSRFALVRAQTSETADHLVALGAGSDVTRTSGDMKAAAAPPPADPTALAAARMAIAGRRVWAAVSTHPGEEAQILAAHDALSQAHPDALLLLVPRHPERADDILALAPNGTMARRSAGEAPGTDTPVWLCDTLGETGLWFRIAPVTFLGGSLEPIGGHNPWEPAQLGTALLHGPNVANSATSYQTLTDAGGCRAVTAETLADQVIALMANPDEATAMARAAQSTAGAQTAAVDEIATRLLALAAPTR